MTTAIRYTEGRTVLVEVPAGSICSRPGCGVGWYGTTEHVGAHCRDSDCIGVQVLDPARTFERYERGYTEVFCCGEWLDCGGRFTTTCDACGGDYNSAGQRLADRSQWGEETGEHWSDCY